MDLVILCLVITLFAIGLLPTEAQEEEKDNKIYKLSHCEIHKWISKPTGFDGKEFESKYTVCSECGYNPETGKYE